MSLRSTNDKNSMADAMSEYHRDQDSSWNQKAAQSPSKAFGSWDGNKYVFERPTAATARITSYWQLFQRAKGLLPRKE